MKRLTHKDTYFYEQNKFLQRLSMNKTNFYSVCADFKKLFKSSFSYVEDYSDFIFQNIILCDIL